MISRNYKTEAIKETPHGLDVRQMYSDPTAQIMHLILKSGESLKPHKTAVDVCFYVLEGTPTVHVGEEAIVYEQDTIVESPANIVHYLSNESTQNARILVIKAPRPGGPAKMI